MKKACNSEKNFPRSTSLNVFSGTLVERHRKAKAKWDAMTEEERQNVKDNYLSLQAYFAMAGAGGTYK